MDLNVKRQNIFIILTKYFACYFAKNAERFTFEVYHCICVELQQVLPSRNTGID